MSCLPTIGDGPDARAWKDVPAPDQFDYAAAEADKTKAKSKPEN
jgi:hypothetical protein